MSEIPLEFRDVSFGYGEHRVLDHVSFTIHPGELAALIGPNGGGKTTILKLTLGLLEADQGSIQLFGQSPHEAVLRQAYVPQYSLFDPLFPAVVEEVVLTGRIGASSEKKSRWPGLFHKEERRQVARVLEQVGLEGLEKRPFSKLSGGQRQRVLIARALAGEAELLLMDEPTSNVDRSAEKEIYAILEGLKGKKTILLVSHDTGVVSSLADSILCINRTLASHPGCELTGEALGKLYGSEMQLVMHSHHQEGDNA